MITRIVNFILRITIIVGIINFISMKPIIIGIICHLSNTYYIGQNIYIYTLNIFINETKRNTN